MHKQLIGFYQLGFTAVLLPVVVCDIILCHPVQCPCPATSKFQSHYAVYFRSHPWAELFQYWGYLAVWHLHDSVWNTKNQVNTHLSGILWRTKCNSVWFPTLHYFTLPGTEYQSIIVDRYESHKLNKVERYNTLDYCSSFWLCHLLVDSLW